MIRSGSGSVAVGSVARDFDHLQVIQGYLQTQKLRLCVGSYCVAVVGINRLGGGYRQPSIT